jgi:hypothetical protein
MSQYGEPWNLDDYQKVIEANGENMVTTGFALGSGYPVGELESKRDRIIACVNACAGIENPADLKAQRDELVEALKREAARTGVFALDATTCLLEKYKAKGEK